MTQQAPDKINVFWFLPTHGDGRYLGTTEGGRPVDLPYLQQVALAADSLGYYGVLIPTGKSCEDSWLVASALAPLTRRLRYLVAVRPGLQPPTLAARMAATLDRLSEGRLLINVGYVYDYELLLKIPSFYDVRVSPVDETKVDDMLQDVTLQEAEDTVDFLEKADKVLTGFSCSAEIKQFTPENLPAFYYQNESAKMYNTLKKAQENSGELFNDMLSGFSSEYKKKAEATLFFNLRNPVVKKMAASHSDTKIEDIITIIYIVF